MECGPVGDSKFVRSHGQAAPLLEPDSAPLDSVALLIHLGIGAGRVASRAASPQAVSDLVGGLGGFVHENGFWLNFRGLVAERYW